MGIPSAFYQIGWEFHDLDRLYLNVDAVPRIRDSGQLAQFIDGALETKTLPGAENLENYSGALERTWNAISRLVNSE